MERLILSGHYIKYNCTIACHQKECFKKTCQSIKVGEEGLLKFKLRIQMGKKGTFRLSMQNGCSYCYQTNLSNYRNFVAFLRPKTASKGENIQ